MVDPFDVIEDLGERFIPGTVMPAIEPFFFHPREKLSVTAESRYRASNGSPPFLEAGGSLYIPNATDRRMSRPGLSVMFL